MIRIVRLSFHEEHRADFLDFFEERKQRIRNSPGCMHLELWEDHYETGVFYTYSIWEHDSDLQHYRRSELFEETWTRVKQWFREAPQAFSAQPKMKLP